VYPPTSFQLTPTKRKHSALPKGPLAAYCQRAGELDGAWCSVAGGVCVLGDRASDYGAFWKQMLSPRGTVPVRFVSPVGKSPSFGQGGRGGPAEALPWVNTARPLVRLVKWFGRCAEMTRGGLECTKVLDPGCVSEKVNAVDLNGGMMSLSSQFWLEAVSIKNINIDKTCSCTRHSIPGYRPAIGYRGVVGRGLETGGAMLCDLA